MLITSEVKVKDKIAEIAKELATLNAKEQAKFFDIFCAELYSICEGMHHIQMTCIDEALGTQAKYLISQNISAP